MSLVKYHPPSKEDCTQPRLDTFRVAGVVDVNAKPAAVKVGPFLNTKGDVVRVRRKWIPVGWTEPYNPPAPKQKPRQLRGRRATL
jgi:hypothetical protein